MCERRDFENNLDRVRSKSTLWVDDVENLSLKKIDGPIGEIQGHLLEFASTHL